MPRKKLTVSITLLVVFVLIAGLLQFVPISISFGERCDDNMYAGSTFLQPGKFYLIQANKSTKLSDGEQTIPCGVMGPGRFIGAGFFHDGKRKDDEKKYCGGSISKLLQDNSDIKYRCEKCKKVWEQIPADK